MPRPYAGDYSDPKTGEINEAGLELISRAAGLGLSRKHIAALLGMNEDTFTLRRKKFPNIEHSFITGKAQADLVVSNALYKRAKDGDISAIRWYEMTRMGRAEKAEQEVTSTQYVIQAPPPMEEDDWAAEYSPSDLGSS